MKAPIVVIGGGLGGLAAAGILAARGKSVVLLEASGSLGGKVGIEEREGVEFDTGPSVFTLPQILHNWFREVGSDENAVKFVTPEPSFRYLYPDGTVLDIAIQTERTIENIRQAFGGVAAAEFTNYLAYAEQIWSFAAPHFVLRESPSWQTLFQPGALAAVLKLDAGRSMAKAIRKKISCEPLQWLLFRYATYNGSDPRVAPATLNCIAHVELGLGGYGIEGGMYHLIRTMSDILHGHGVEIRLHTPVRKIVVEWGQVVGVDTDAGRLNASAVVANADVSHVFGDLLPRKYEARALSTSGWTAVQKAQRGAGRVAHTVIFPSSYEQEFVDLFDRQQPPTDPTVYLCAQEPAHRRSGWVEHEPVFMMANAPAELEQPSQGMIWEALRTRVIERVQAVNLWKPGDSLIWERTPKQLAVQFPGSRGALYGFASNSKFSAFQRPPNRISEIPGLYLASGSAHPGGGMPLCISSGQITALSILKDLQ